MPRKRNKWLLRSALPAALVTVLALTAVGVVAAYMWVDSELDPFDDQPFDNSRWVTANSWERQPMARGATRQISKGMTSEEVLAILGDPDSIGPSQTITSSHYGGFQTYSYYVGSASYVGLDSAFVWVHFDAGGKVIIAVIGGG